MKHLYHIRFPKSYQTTKDGKPVEGYRWAKNHLLAARLLLVSLKGVTWEEARIITMVPGTYTSKEVR